MSRKILRGLAIAAMFGLATTTLALAQEHKDDHRGPPPKAGGGPPPPHPAGPPPGGPPHPMLKPAFVPHPGPPGPPGGPPHPEFAHPGPGPGGPAFAHPEFAHPGGPPPGGPRFTYRGHDFDRVHIHPFFYPPGWAYRQWAVGAFLPPLFLTPDYFYPDWQLLGLDPPPPGYQWVRYGPDLLLVELDNGQVVDVAYGVFYDD
jgi:hypothetical protein